jgi:hypothetical protein
MPKRFTDTDKWKKPFIRGLQGPYKLLWMYILDDCDHAGIWQVDFEVARIRIGEDVDYQTAEKLFHGRIQVIDKFKWFVPDFITFQYGELSEKNRLHQSVLNILVKYNLRSELAPSKPLIRGQGQGTIQGKEQGQGKGNPDDPDFEDYENWIVDILNMNDYMFHDKIKNVGIQVNGHLKEYTTSYIGLLAEYPNKKPPDQNRFRLGLIKHIQDEQKKQSNGNRTTSKGTSSTISAQIGGTDYDNQQL